MLLTDLYAWIRQRSSDTGTAVPVREINLIIAKTAGIPKELLLARSDLRLGPAAVRRIKQRVEMRLEHYPLQYLFGTVEFMGMDFLITPGVLIPRPESELVVQTALGLAELNRCRDVLDLCCGSGVIGLSMARMNDRIRVSLTDLSHKAVVLAKKNGKKLGLLSRADFYTGDLFSALPQSKKFDLIVSNPPYVPRSRMSRLQQEIRFEPRSAIDGGIKGMEIVSRITGQAAVFLKENGMLVMEHDDTQKKYFEAMAAGLVKTGLRYRKTINDLSGLPRVSIFQREREPE